MNQIIPDKKNNGWILCPSKSYPGKFYYFNVLNGETAWSLDTDNPKSSNFDKVSDKGHSYPEPKGPPETEVLNDTLHTIKHIFNESDNIKKAVCNTIRRRVYNNTFNHTSTPIFGQPPKFIQNSDMYMPNIVWTAIPVPTPMLMQNSDASQCMNRENALDYGKIVHSCTNTLSNRFTTYNRNAQKIDEKKNSVSKSFNTSTLIGCRNQTGNLSFPLRFSKEEEMQTISDSENSLFKRVCTQSEGDGNDCREQKNCDTYNLNSLMESNPVQSNVLLLQDTEHTARITEDTNKLSDDDLRLVILAKRRKSVELSEMLNSQEKKIKTYKIDQNDSKSNPKKRVTFNLHENYDDADVNTNENDIMTSPDRGPSTFYSPLNPENDLWYVIVDPDTLVDEFQVIEQFIKSDEKCRLLLPRSLQSSVEAMCIGDFLGQQRVIVARQSARKLAVPQPYIVPFLPGIDIQNETQNICDVLKICLQVMINKYRSVFITNNTNLYNDAKSLKISCLKTEDLKVSKNTSPKVTFALRKVKVSVANATPDSPSSESALRAPSNNDDSLINSFQMCTVNNTGNITSTVKKVDANTSPIDNDRFIDITHKKTIETFNNEDKKLMNNKPAGEIDCKFNNMHLKSNIEKSKNKDGNEYKIQNTKMADMPPLTIDTKKIRIENSDIDGLSEEFRIKSDLMENTIKDRFSEWFCMLTQIMEDALTELITRHLVITDNLFPPWVLYDAVESVEKMYGYCADVSSFAEKFKSTLLEECSKIGTLKSTMTPTEFMRLFAYGMMLIRSLKAELPSYVELEEAEESLRHLLKEMENPSDDFAGHSFHTPVVSRTELVEETTMKRNFIRQRSDVIDYLKKHFDAWKNYVPEESEENMDNQMLTENNTNKNIKIVRTIGRNLKLLNIDSDKTIRLKNPIDNAAEPSSANTALDKQREHDLLNATIKDLDLSVLDGNTNENVDQIKKLTNSLKLKCNDNHISNDEDFYMVKVDHDNIAKIYGEPHSSNVIADGKNAATQSNDDLNVPKHGNTFDKSDQNRPTVVRKVHKIQAYEDKLRESIDFIDLDVVDYSELIEDTKNNYFIDDTSFEEAASFVYEIKGKTARTNNDIINDRISDKDRNDNIQTNVVNTTTVDSSHNANTFSNAYDNFHIIDINDSTNDSGFENESQNVHFFLKMFLSELCQFLKSVHNFIVISMRKFKRVNSDEQWKDDLHTKVGKLHRMIAKIILKLNGIISRESKEVTVLKAMLQKAGDEAANDKRLTKYRQVVTKCLEQTLILDNALKLMGSLSNHGCEGSISTTYTLDTNIRYINIYE